MNDKQDDREELGNVQAEEPTISASPVRKLTRSTDDKVIGGVAGGLGAYFGIDPVLIRIAFVVMLVLGGTGLLVYLLLWLVMPVGPNEPSVGEVALQRTRDWPSWIGWVLIVMAVAFLADGLDWWEPELVWGLGLVALGVYLLVRKEPDSARAVPDSPTGPPATMASSAAEITAPRAAQAPVKAARRPRSVLGPLTLGAALLASGTAVVLDNLDLVEMNAPRYFALVLAIVGIGLVAGAWWGRSPGLIVIGVLLAPMVFLSGLSAVPFEGGAGERSYQPLTVEGIRDEYRLAAGAMLLDLSKVRFDDESVEIEASVALGELIVIVPGDVSVDVTVEVGAGELRAFGVNDEGLDLDLTTGIEAGTGGHLVLDAGAGLGSVEVYQDQPFEEAPR